jgi:hypothetical protein
VAFVFGIRELGGSRICDPVPEPVEPGIGVGFGREKRLQLRAQIRIVRAQAVEERRALARRALQKSIEHFDHSLGGVVASRAAGVVHPARSSP